MKKAMQATGCRMKMYHKQIKIKQLRGKLHWQGDLDKMRRDN